MFLVALTTAAINRLVCKRETGCALCELAPGFLYITTLNVAVQTDKNFIILGSVTFKFITVEVSVRMHRCKFLRQSQRTAESNTRINNR